MNFPHDLLLKIVEATDETSERSFNVWHVTIVGRLAIIFIYQEKHFASSSSFFESFAFRCLRLLSHRIAFWVTSAPRIFETNVRLIGIGNDLDICIISNAVNNTWKVEYRLILSPEKLLIKYTINPYITAKLFELLRNLFRWLIDISVGLYYITLQ